MTHVVVAAFHAFGIPRLVCGCGEVTVDAHSDAGGTGTQWWAIGADMRCHVKTGLGLGYTHNDGHRSCKATDQHLGKHDE